MLTPLQRRSIRIQGEIHTHEALAAERKRTGTPGLEAWAEGSLRQIVLELSLLVSPDAAKQIFHETFVDGVLADAADPRNRAHSETGAV